MYIILPVDFVWTNKNRMLKRIIGQKTYEIIGDGENCIMRSFVTW
jgi:hypothetical protein